MRRDRFFASAGLLLLAACSAQRTPSTAEDPYVGEYTLAAYAPTSIRITRDRDLFLQNVYVGQNPWAPAARSPEKLEQRSDREFSFVRGQLVFGSPEAGRYQSFTMLPLGQTYLRVEKAIAEYRNPQAQGVYDARMLRELGPGKYTYSRFLSPARGPVDFAVYLPPDWTTEGKRTYPLLFFLHGQDGSEHFLPFGVPASQLNAWIDRGDVPPFVLMGLRSGRFPDGREEQWLSPRNELLLTSDAPTEIRAFAQRYFRAGMRPRSTSIHGHSRGSAGSLHLALNYPDRFASSVSNALVSDYAFPQSAASARRNVANILASGIRYRLSIGDADQFVVELHRRMAADTHALLTDLAVDHEYEVLPKVSHDFRELWNYRRADGEPNGLYELRFHARAWSADMTGADSSSTSGLTQR